MSQALPLHQKIRELIARDIALGHRAVGDRLPPESLLATQLGCAVGTLRKALTDLVAQGLIERKHGSGNYVKVGLASQSVYEFFRLELWTGGGLPTAQVLQFDLIASPTDIPVLGKNGGSKSCYRVRRLRSLNNQVVALEEIYFDARQKVEIADLGEAMYQFYQERLGFWIASAQDRVGLAAVPSWTNPLFKPKASEVCGYVERASWSAKGVLEEYSRTWFDPARARYVTRM